MGSWAGKKRWPGRRRSQPLLAEEEEREREGGREGGNEGGREGGRKGEREGRK